MRDQLAMEMQNVAFGMDSGFKYITTRDPQVKKALEVMPEAAAMLKKKVLTLQTPKDRSLVAHN
jgi:carboxyl-terminal processing protease